MTGPSGNYLVEPFSSENEALNIFDFYPDKYDWVVKNCKSIWSLFFATVPKAGGYAYFNAAIASGFTLFSFLAIVHRFKPFY